MVQLHKHEIVESVGLEGRGTTVVVVYSEGEGDNPLDDLLDAINIIPEEYRNKAILRVHDWGLAEVVYFRPESDGELRARQAWLRSLRDEDELRDRQVYERLKKKFEGKD